MKKLTEGQTHVLDFVSETICWFFPLLFVLFALGGELMPESSFGPGAPYFLAVAVTLYFGVYAYRAVKYRKKGKLGFITDIISAGLMIVFGVMLFFRVPILGFISSVGFLGVIALRRVVRLIENHKPSRIVMAIMIWAIIGVLILIMSDRIYGLVMELTIMILAVANIISIAFSRIRLGVLLRILRKTYTGEILFGMVTLIIVFSLVFYFMEDNINSFGDALWYCFAIVTTIGFGDFVAMDPVCRGLSVILGLYGIVVVAAITSVIVNFYMEVSNKGEPETEEEKKMDQRTVADAFDPSQGTEADKSDPK